MNRVALMEFLINNRFLSSKLGEKINEVLQRLLKVKPAYAPVKVRQHPADLRNNRNR